jgi:hypothetical protein
VYFTRRSRAGLSMPIAPRGTSVARARGEGERYCAPQRPRRAGAFPTRALHPPLLAPVRSSPVARPKRSLGRMWAAGSKSRSLTVIASRSTPASSLLGRLVTRPRSVRRPSLQNRSFRAEGRGPSRSAPGGTSRFVRFAAQRFASLTPGLLARRRLRHPAPGAGRPARA